MRSNYDVVITNLHDEAVVIFKAVRIFKATGDEQGRGAVDVKDGVLSGELGIVYILPATKMVTHDTNGKIHEELRKVLCNPSQGKRSRYSVTSTFGYIE
ncbi:uncharacterized protein LTR77_002761 [Saxophila tyrrhenica]|uniref:Uncharacterized protein n=1 Tax=Saxophila tyrrhenica TaxID=1690608 RepID=A0AAV9PFJ6_9PEZI|nr:hypothetical protein LTR77_002761 [Saxophila tyrrhenica]